MDTNHIPCGTYRVATGPETFSVHSAYKTRCPVRRPSRTEYTSSSDSTLLGSSSLPVGGAGCHSILTGHSGVAGNKLFSDIDQLSEGDVFYLRVLDETLAYEVEAVNIVLPYETELLAPIRGRDLCTLVTCYPYGVNTHRLLVRGKRIPYEEAVVIERKAEEEPVRSTWKEQYVKGLAIGGASAAGAMLIVLLICFIRKKRRHR